MRRPSTDKWPIASFNLPPHPPAAVQEAYAHFDRLGDEFGRLRGEIRDAEEAIRTSRQQDVRRIADAAAAGKQVSDQDKHQREAQANIERLEQRRDGVALALDEAGNTLAKAIVQHRTEWLATLAESDREASARFTTALAEAKAAIVDLRPARGAVEWLERFEAGPAVAGEHSGFAGGQVFLDTRSIPRDLRTPVAVVVELLETITTTDTETTRRAAA